MPVSAGEPSPEKKTDAGEGEKGKTEREQASNGLGSKRGVLRYSGRGLLPEIVAEGGCQRRVAAVSVALGDGAAGRSGGGSTALGRTRGTLVNVQMKHRRTQTRLW